MKKVLTLIGITLLPLLMPSCWLIDKPEQVTSHFYKEVIYEFNDEVDYFTADLLSCYGVRDEGDPTKGTIYATIEIKINTTCQLLFDFPEDLADKCYITRHMGDPNVKYQVAPIRYAFYENGTITKGETVQLKLEFPNVPTSFLKVARLRVSVRINEVTHYAFTIHQIPYRPISDLLSWE